MNYALFRRSCIVFQSSGAKRGHRKRTHHNQKQWEIDKGNWLTALPRNLCPVDPNFVDHPQRVDKPLYHPVNEKCFNCDHKVDTTADHQYIWIPSGNAKLPTPQGYIFHRNCFKCIKCKYAFQDNLFVSQSGRALCPQCAMDAPIRRPRINWHRSNIEPAQFASRRVGHMFPRHEHQLNFLYDPDK